jgi:choline dehydrogenase
MYDYIIVGAGSAGCVLANRLSADPQRRVLLLEAGGPDKRTEIHIPAAWSKTLKTELDWNYYTEPQEHLNNRQLYWPRGKTLGGSSSINAMIYIRGSRWDYDNWAMLGSEGWSYDDVLPYFKKGENNERGADDYHGVGGPLNVKDQPCPNPLTEAFVRGAQTVGLPYRADFNGEDQMGVGILQTTTKNGKRHSAAAAYLKPVMGRPNLTVLTHAHTTRILFEGKKAVGVEYIHEGFPRQARTRREVILSGGAINSPQLLMLSGIGPADHLRELGIEVLSDLPGVGQNLQDHQITGVGYHCTKPISMANANRPQTLLQYLLTGKGMLQSNGAEGGGFVKIDPDAPAPDVQFHFLPAFAYNHLLTPLEGHGFTLGVTVLRPESRGYISLRSANPADYPVIQPNYLSDAQGKDLRLFVEAIKLAREIVFTRPFDAYRGAEFLPGYHVQTDEDIRDYVRQQVQTLYHPVGTCKMGADPMAVVNEQLQVHTVENLRVVDGSIMPVIASGNTNAPIMMIAEKAADLILQQF